MRKSIDFHTDAADAMPHLDEDEAATPISWIVAVSDDYLDETPRVQLTLEEVGRAGQGVIAHLDADGARRLRRALAVALAEFGEPAGS
jgi:hypothetical protein